MKLIDKDALVAEIENLIDKGRYHEEYDCAYRDGNNSALYALKGKINTLEVKEVDLQEESQVKESAKTQHEKNTCKENGDSLTQKSETIDFEQELYKAFGQIKDFTLGMRIAKRFYEIGRNYQEPVNEDLKEAYERYVDERMILLRPDIADMSCDRDTKMSFDVFDGSELEAAFYEGAKWQKAKVQETIETAIHHAYHNGKLEMKEQMMAKPVSIYKNTEKK